MKISKLFILAILSLIVITMSSFIYAANTASNVASDIGNTAKDIGTGITDTAKNVGNGIKNGVSDMGNSISDTTNNATTGIIDTTNTLKNDINEGINNNTNTDTSPNNYYASRVGYTDTVDFLGMTMSRTSLILFVIALAAIIVAVLVFAYVSQDNDRYRDNS